MFFTKRSSDGYHIYKNDEPILECICSSEGKMEKSCTCFTGGVFQFNREDVVKIASRDKEHKLYLESTKSYWGMFKLGGS